MFRAFPETLGAAKLTLPRSRSAVGRGILVVGLGNPDRGDDAIGALVADALAGQLPAGVTMLKCAGDPISLIDDWTGFDALVCIDAAQTGAAPGAVHRIDLATESLPPEERTSSSHAFGLAQAIALSRQLGTAPRVVIVYAVEAGGFGIGAPLTDAVAAALPAVAREVAAEVARLRDAALHRTAAGLG